MSEVLRLEAETKKMIRCILLPYREGLLLTDLEGEYYGMLGRPLPWRKLGFSSLLDLVTKMPEVVRAETLPYGHILLHATADQSTQHIAAMVSQQREDPKWGYNKHTTHVLKEYRGAPRTTIAPQAPAPASLPPGLRTDLSSLLLAFPRGLPASRLLTEFRRHHGRELNMTGSSSPVQLCSRLPDLVSLQPLGEDWLLLGAAPPPWQLALPQGELQELVVTAVKSPGHVCVFPRAKADAVRGLEAALSPDCPVAPDLEVGAMVAAPRDGRWARAKVVTILSLKEVKLLFLDYGDTERAMTEVLRKLPEGLPSLAPPFALRCALLGVTPPQQGAPWPKEQCRRLKELVRAAASAGGGMVLGGFRSEAGGTPLLYLVDTASNSLEGGIHINKVLEEAGGQETWEEKAEVQGLLGSLSSLVLERLEQCREEEVVQLRAALQACLDGLKEEADSPDMEDKVVVEDHVMATGGEEASFHIIKLPGEEEQRWVTSREIAGLVPNWGGRDLLRRMLQVKRIVMEERRLGREDRRVLGQLAEASLCGGTEEELVLYRKEDIPVIVKMFKV